MAESYKPEITMELKSEEVDDMQANMEAIVERIKTLM